jgi:proline iminopeptidase
MRQLYPPLEPTAQWMLEVGAVHRVYVEECGNPAGIPVVFLHGGPGSGCKPYHRQFFDPGRYRIIIFDQRGCGRSTPLGETAENDTHTLLADIEAIRARLGVERWVVFGGSWGATLALLYAQRFPQQVLALVLRGTFLARQIDVDWFFHDGVSRLFPDAWAAFTSAFPQAHDGDFIAAAWQAMQSADATVRATAAQAWSRWTGRIVTWLLPASNAAPASGPEQVNRIIQEVAIETHYARHRYFIGEDEILRHVDRLPAVPTTIIHGRRDLTCLLEASWALHRQLPDSTLQIVAEAGHLANDPPMIDALVCATDNLARTL